MTHRFAPPTTLARRLSRVASVVVAAVALASGCAADVDDEASFAGLTRVRPRVVVDGLIELSGLTDGRLFVDEVVIHAGTTELRARDGAVVDLLATDPSAQGSLVFRYKLGHSAASSTSCGVERDWDLSSGDTASDLVFGFSPFDGATLGDAAGGMPTLGSLDDVDLSVLDGATALIHGFVSVPADDANVTALAATGDGTVSGGDPDGAPGKAPARDTGDASGGDPDGAPGKTGGLTSGGDPDGAPGRTGSNDGSTEGGDPDGAPGKSGGFAQVSGGDPDGAPGKIGPGIDGTVAGGDPDGAPGRTHEATASAAPGMPAGNPFAGGGPSIGAPTKPGDVLVPFVLLLDERFSLAIPFASLRAVGRDEVLPIDLHLDAQGLFTQSLLDVLLVRAADDSQDDGAVTLSVDGEGTLFDVTVASPVSNDTSPPDVGDPLTVSSDLRDEVAEESR